MDLIVKNLSQDVVELIEKNCVRYGDKSYYTQEALRQYWSSNKPQKRQIKKKVVKQKINNEFDEFYSLYPKKVGKKMAIKAWVKLDPSKELRQIILKDLNYRTINNLWPEENKFIPNPSTYLNQERWTDEYQPSEQEAVNNGTYRGHSRKSQTGTFNKIAEYAEKRFAELDDAKAREIYDRTMGEDD